MIKDLASGFFMEKKTTQHNLIREIKRISNSLICINKKKRKGKKNDSKIPNKICFLFYSIVVFLIVYL